jgi:subtilase family serine protease
MAERSRKGIRLAFFAVVCAGWLTGSAGASAGLSASVPAAAGLASLPGHIHKFAQPRLDRGEAPSSLRMAGLELIIAKTMGQQQALDELVADQQNPKSPQYHRWLTPVQYGSRFGASDAAMAALSRWLESNGFQVGNVPAGRGHLPFTGSKAQVEAAFHTQIHLFNVNGERHYANVSDPMVPVSLKSVIAAVRGLNDFYPKPGAKPMSAVARGVLPSLAGHSARTASRTSSSSPDTFYSGSDQYPGYVGPTDFAVIYNLLPAYQQGLTGAGVTVAIAGQSDIDSSVLTAFWSAFGVAGSNFGLPAQQFSSIPVPAADGGTDPGETKDGNEDEAYLDTEIVGALAPGAKIILVRDQNVGVAAEYAVDQNLSAILNVSFGGCEGAEGAANTTINALWQQAVAEGITVTVSSADAGVATCTAQADVGTADDVSSTGFAVNGLASTPYDLAVGGTDFNLTTESAYWNSSNLSGTLASAKSHIPEMVWNDSCANPVIAQAFGIGDPIVFCNATDLPSSTTANPFIEIAGSGAGVSSCISTDGSGNCSGGYAQPSWQQGVVGSNAGARTVPDVSMIATRWLMCSYDTTPCDPTQPPTFPPAPTGTIKVLDGTSAAAPSVAAIIAMLDQALITPTQTDGRQGLVNPLLYGLAASEYQNPAIETQCDASQGPITSPLCVFYDVTSGSNAQPCSVAHYASASAGSLPASTCGSESGDATGIMEVNGAQDYVASSGFDIATGLGSINVGALIGASVVPAVPTGLKVSAAGAGVLSLTWTASRGANTYELFEGTKPGAEGTTPVATGVSGVSTTVGNLTAGQEYFFTVAAIDTKGPSAQSAEASGTVIPAVPTGLAATGGNGTVSLSWSAATGASSYNVYEGTSSGGESTAAVQTGVTGPSASVGGLQNGTTYYFDVVAVNAGGTSAASAQVKATPAAPSGGGGSMDWLALGLLGLAFARVARC